MTDVQGEVAELPKVVILISGAGSNLRALLAASLPMRCECVISNNPAAGGLAIADTFGVPTCVLNHRNFSSRDEFDQALIDVISEIDPKLIILAGFMRRLGAEFVRTFSGKVLNIHPSLLPKYPGLNTYERALAAGDEWVGTSVHWVTEEVDGGPLLAQRAVPVLPGETAACLREKVQKIEHVLYSSVIRSLLAE